MTTNIRVLLVEDHMMTRMGMQLVLEKAEGIELIAEAENGEEAVAKAEELEPDVILMDIGLPVMDGIEATQTIKDKKLTSRILVFTSRDNEEDVFAALGAGADAYCMKGASPEQLTSAIKAVNEGTAWLDPAIAKTVLGAINKSQKTAPQQLETSEKQTSELSNLLTNRELEVLQLIVEGLSNPQIAERLYITRATAKAHVHSILQKLCVDDRTQAAVTAMREGLV
ncbi:MAG: response regulator [Vampirovibrionia bacterium]